MMITDLVTESIAESLCYFQYLKSVTKIPKLPPTSTVTNICNQHQSLLSLRVQVAHVAKSFGFELENFNFFDYRLIIKLMN